MSAAGEQKKRIVLHNKTLLMPANWNNLQSPVVIGGSHLFIKGAQGVVFEGLVDSILRDCLNCRFDDKCVRCHVHGDYNDVANPRNTCSGVGNRVAGQLVRDVVKNELPQPAPVPLERDTSAPSIRRRVGASGASSRVSNARGGRGGGRSGGGGGAGAGAGTEEPADAESLGSHDSSDDAEEARLRRMEQEQDDDEDDGDDGSIGSSASDDIEMDVDDYGPNARGRTSMVPMMRREVNFSSGGVQLTVEVAGNKKVLKPFQSGWLLLGDGNGKLRWDPDAKGNGSLQTRGMANFYLDGDAYRALTSDETHTWPFTPGSVRLVPLSEPELEHPNAPDGDSRVCSICLSRAVKITFVPCSCSITCITCANRLISKPGAVCPNCAVEITQLLQFKPNTNDEELKKLEENN